MLEKTVVQLFEEQAEKVSDQIAVVCEDERITYKELNKKANALAHRLRKLGVGSDDYVVIMAEKSIELIVGILGIIKAGGAYVPLDPNYPKNRISYILEDCQPKVLLSGQRKLEVEIDVPIVELKAACRLEEVNTNLELVNNLSDLIYLMYTSGTTGRAKGVMIEHRNVVSLVKNTNYVDFDNIVIGQAGSLSFDASTFEIWGAILNGGKVVLLPEEVLLNAKRLKSELIKKEINTMFVTTALYNQLVSLDSSTFDPLNQLLFGGEATSEEHVRKLINKNVELNFSNIYGPTENTTFSLHYPIAEKTLKDKTPIGKAISGTKAYILNNMNLCGLDVTGELCLSGDGIARGYLNRPELTAEKFIDNPYGEGKLYRTGDLARWQSDGNIEYAGRIDDQVKIRGYRIELGEIENVMRQIEGVREVAVIVKEDRNNNKSLHAYYTAKESLESSTIENDLRCTLPDYMIPPYMKQIDEMPITVHGKLDKKSLPEIEVGEGTKYVAPRNEKERVLSEIFEEILGVQNASVKDSFFALGGESIKAIQIVSKMREAGYEINVKDIMNRQTIEAISEIVTTAEELSYEQDEVVGEVELTPIIEGFGSWGLKEPHHFNMGMIMKVEGVAEEAEKVIETLVSHHDMLRAVYIEGRLNIPRRQGRPYEYEVCDFREEAEVEKKIEQRCDAKQISMNLETGPLVKCIFFQLKEGNYLFTCFHHLVVDGVSMRILMEDFHSGLKQLKEGKEIKLPKKTISFKEWSEELTKYKDSNKLGKEMAYWTKIESRMREGKYKGTAQGMEDSFKNIFTRLSQEETAKLVKESGEAYQTEINDLLLSALSMTVKKLSGQEKVTVILEGHGREELHKSIKVDRTVGWFSSMYPIILECYDEVETSINYTKEMLRNVPNHGLGYGLLLGNFEEGDINFNYLGEMEQTREGLNSYSIGRLASDKNRIPGDINIVGYIVSKRLNLAVRYNKRKYSEEEMSEFINVYNESLLEVIYHCYSRTNRFSKAA